MTTDDHTVVCPECGGDGRFDPERPGQDWLDCRFCGGTGQVPTEAAGDIDDYATPPAPGGQDGE